MSQAIHPSAPAYPKYPTILHALARAVDLRPDATAIVCQDRELTFRTYALAFAALAERFTTVGAVRGERIAFVIGNSLEACVGLLAGMAAGAQVSPLNPNYTDVELETLLRDVRPLILVCDAASFEKAHMLTAKLDIAHLIQFGPGALTLDELLLTPAGALPLPEQSDRSVLFFTGGTTGLPKGAQNTGAG